MTTFSVEDQPCPSCGFQVGVRKYMSRSSGSNGIHDNMDHAFCGWCGNVFYVGYFGGVSMEMAERIAEHKMLFYRGMLDKEYYEYNAMFGCFERIISMKILLEKEQNIPHTQFRKWEDITKWEEDHKDLVAEYERKGEELQKNNPNI